VRAFADQAAIAIANARLLVPVPRFSTHAQQRQILISQRVFAEVEDVVETELVGEVEPPKRELR
jgi:hypothetical protein